MKSPARRWFLDSANLSTMAHLSSRSALLTMLFLVLFLMMTKTVFAADAEEHNNEVNTKLPHISVGAQLLINKEHRLMYCFMQKNGCTQGVKLLLHLAGRQFTGWASLYKRPKGQNLDPWARTYDEDKINEYFNDDEWTRMVFVRDPAYVAFMFES